MQTEAVPKETSSAKATGSASVRDPVLLGVSLPLSITVSAATQVRDAWKDALTAVVAAAKEKASAKKAKVSKKANGSGTTEIKA